MEESICPRQAARAVGHNRSYKSKQRQNERCLQTQVPPEHQTLWTEPNPPFHCLMSLHGSCQASLRQRRPQPACLPSQPPGCLTGGWSVQLSVWHLNPLVWLAFCLSAPRHKTCPWSFWVEAKGAWRSACQWELKGKCRGERRWSRWRETSQTRKSLSCQGNYILTNNDTFKIQTNFLKQAIGTFAFYTVFIR